MPQNLDFKLLIKQLDNELAVTDGDEHSFYNQFNGIENIKNAVILYDDNKPLVCGAFKQFNPQTVEIKRMYTAPLQRRKGLASKMLNELEKWAKELGYNKCILETGKRQPDAIALYKKSGYQTIPNYGQYTGKENSVCFEKLI